MVQTVTYNDDTVLTAQSQRDFKEPFVVLVRVAKNIGLEINKEKTKYLVATRKAGLRPQGIRLREVC